MALDLAHGHAAGVHRHDLVVEARQPPAILGDQLRIEGRQPVARHRDRQLAAVGEQRLAAIAVAAVGTTLGGLAIQMVVHLGVQRPLRQRALQLVDQAVPAKGGLRITAGEELVEQSSGIIGALRRAMRGFLPSQTFDPPGTFVPLHVHPTQDEFIYVLEGLFDLQLGDDEAAGQAG